MDIIGGLQGISRIIIGFLFLLVIPGFLLSFVLFPKQADLRISERVVYTTVLSIGTAIISVLFMDVFLGVDTTPLNIIIVLSAVSFILIVLCGLRILYQYYSFTEKIRNFLWSLRGLFNREILGRIRRILKRFNEGPKIPPENIDL